MGGERRQEASPPLVGSCSAILAASSRQAAGRLQVPLCGPISAFNILAQHQFQRPHFGVFFQSLVRIGDPLCGVISVSQLRRPLINLDVYNFLFPMDRRVSALTHVAVDEHAFGDEFALNHLSEP